MAFQAYDGHMNLILSDVEETIMIVDSADGTTNPQNATVNVSKKGYMLTGFMLME